jgi:hypothetical protein
LAESQNGVTLQVYVAIIASLLLSLWAGRKPTKRTYEMFVSVRRLAFLTAVV